MSCCYDRSVWTAEDIEIVFDDEFCSGSIVTARIRTPNGELELIGEIERFDRELVVAGSTYTEPRPGTKSVGLAAITTNRASSGGDCGCRYHRG